MSEIKIWEKLGMEREDWNKIQNKKLSSMDIGKMTISEIVETLDSPIKFWEKFGLLVSTGNPELIDTWQATLDTQVAMLESLGDDGSLEIAQKTRKLFEAKIAEEQKNSNYRKINSHFGFARTVTKGSYSEIGFELAKGSTWLFHGQSKSSDKTFPTCLVVHSSKVDPKDMESHAIDMAHVGDDTWVLLPISDPTMGKRTNKTGKYFRNLESGTLDSMSTFVVESEKFSDTNFNHEIGKAVMGDEIGSKRHNNGWQALSILPPESKIGLAEILETPKK